MGYKLPTPLCALLLIAAPCAAKPVQWPGGVMFMAFHDQDMDSLNATYSFSAKDSIGNRTDYYRRDKSFIGGMHWNHLVKRWNWAAAQANIYTKLGAGVASNSARQSGALYGGVLADYETRRVFASYENDLLYGGRVSRWAWHSGRVGVAPYVGGYDDIHTWVMVQGDYRPGGRHLWSATPLLRFFKTQWMLEVGATLRGDGMINAMIQF